MWESNSFILSKTSSSKEFNPILVNTVGHCFSTRLNKIRLAISEIPFENPPLFVDRWYLLARGMTQSVMVLYDV